ncbi:site-specific integrase [Microcoleus sp. C2C3]|uniref:site-specific integrase n=1 Tax=unclassified Microcoleus TaxID=2642155 RepID=UPI002FCFFB19
MQPLTPELRSLLNQLSQHLQSEPDKNPPLLEVWDAWVENLDLSPQTRADHYATLRSQILRASPLSSEISWLLNFEIAPATFNKKLGYLRACGNWAKSEGLVSANPWLKVRPRKGSKEIIKPFSQNEAAKIISGFEKSYPAWTPFAKFLFLSGCRMSEAIGLQWKHVNFERKEICICESLAQCKDGNGYERIRKSTKTGSVRFLKINVELAKVFEQVSPASKNSEDLVFLNPAGTSHIDSNNFRDRWKKVLTAAKIPYRRPHVIRHSFASHAIEQGCPLTGVAYLLGHSDTRMVATTYGHLINRPELPSIL